MKTGNKKCDLCGAMVAHIHLVRDQQGREIQGCCECRDRALSPLEMWMKSRPRIAAALSSGELQMTSSPCLLDEFADLTDEAVVDLCVKAYKTRQKKKPTYEDLLRSYAVLKWGEIEPTSRGRSDLVKAAFRSDPS